MCIRDRLWDVHHALQSSSKRLERTTRVTGPQRLVIRIVGEFPGSSAGDVAHTMRVHPSTLTGILRRLEKHGLIERRPDPADARRALFVLTSEGARLNVIEVDTPEAAVQQALAEVAAADVEGTRRVLARVAALLGPTPPGRGGKL